MATPYKGNYNDECIRYLNGLGVLVQKIEIRRKCIIIDKEIMWIPSIGYLATESKNNSACRLKNIEVMEDIYLDLKNNIIL